MGDRSFEFSHAATVDAAGDWRIAAAPFTTQSVSDLFGYNAIDGTVWVGANTGNGFDLQKWATVDPVDGWQFVVGDFTGSGLSDVVGYHPSNGSLWLGESTGAGFAFQQWGTVDPVDGWQFAAGYFLGHAKKDLFGYHPSNGSLWVGENTGAGFEFQQWGNVDPVDGWQFMADDITGTGRTDIVGYFPGNGTVWVGENSGTRFDLSQWAELDPLDGWQFHAGHFNGRAKGDLFGYHPSNGSLWVGANSGNTFSFDEWGRIFPAGGWRFAVEAFNDDLWTDVAALDPSTGAIWLGRSNLRSVEGYCWPLSAAPGEQIQFMLSGEGSSHVVIRRHSSTSDTIDSVDVMTLDVAVAGRAVPPGAWQYGCGWPETFALTIPDTWTSGIYAASCTDEGDNSCDVTFVVKPAENTRTNIALLANVNTWLAYNGWGGESKYSGRAKTSFMRPNPGAGPTGDYHLTHGELWILGWLSSVGCRPDVFTDIDFHNAGCDASQYSCLVLSTHPEYWSRQMYDKLAAYLDQGGSLLYLGGNGIYENGEYEPDQTGMVFRQGIEGGPRITSLFRVLDPAMPERALLGVATERCGVDGSAYSIDAADHPLFAGVTTVDSVSRHARQVVNGDLFGERGLNLGWGNGKASGWEVDTRAGVGALSVPIECATEASAIRASPLPDGVVVLATAEPDAGGLGAEMVFYEHTGGGIVFSVGSLSFGGSLVVDSTIQQLMRNVLTRAGVA